jgi:hypothetical protein
VLTLEEFRELMKSLEGATIPNERVIILFNEALEMSSYSEKEDRLTHHASSMLGAGSSMLPSKPNNDPDKMSPECFVEAVIRNRIGGYGKEFLDFDFL